MVVAYCSRRNEFHGRAVEQPGIAFRPGAGDQCVRIQKIVPRDASAGKIDELRIRFQYAFQEGNFVVRHDFQHDSASSFPFSARRCS